MLSENLRSARIRSGLSLRALEEKIGKIVSAQAIGKYERGDMQPSQQVVEALANALGVGKEFFFTKQSVELGVVEFRENSARHRVDEKAISSAVYDSLLRYLEVEGLLGVTSTDWDKPRQFPYPIRQLAEAEWAAHKLRDDWQLGSDPIPNLSEFLEERGFRIILCDLPLSIAGVTCFVNTSNGQKIPVIVTSAQVTGERQRFTFIHELGHLLLEKSSSELNFEKVCDKFAGAFLMPERFLWDALGKSRSSISVGELVSLKKFLGVSVQAIVYRCKDLGIINEYTYKLLYKEFSNRGWLKPPYKEPNAIDIEKPQRFKRLCLRALAEGLITEKKASEIMMIPEDKLREEFNG
jgi:Zn-dependent peptidase ImmA (M78 family)/DNA-binding XRE family transcriptional regulator